MSTPQKTYDKMTQPNKKAQQHVATEKKKNKNHAGMNANKKRTR
jgi:hypothetical protein